MESHCWTPWSRNVPRLSSRCVCLPAGSGPGGNAARPFCSVPRAQQGWTVPMRVLVGGGSTKRNTVCSPDVASAFSLVWTGAVKKCIKYYLPFIRIKIKPLCSRLLLIQLEVIFFIFYFTTPKNSHRSILPFDWPLHFFSPCAEFCSCWRKEKKTTLGGETEEEATADNKGGGGQKWNNRRLAGRFGNRLGREQEDILQVENETYYSCYIFFLKSPWFCVKVFLV